MNYITHLRQMKNLNRFNGKFLLRSYNLFEHSFGVTALFVHFAKLEGVEYDNRVIDLVINHDMLEVVTTDLVHPVKNYSEKTKQAWATIEAELIEEHPELKMYSDPNIRNILTETQHDLLKMCDLADCLMFCNEEINLGNKEPELFSAKNICEKRISECGFNNLKSMVL